MGCPSFNVYCGKVICWLASRQLPLFSWISPILYLRQVCRPFHFVFFTAHCLSCSCLQYLWWSHWSECWSFLQHCNIPKNVFIPFFFFFCLPMVVLLQSHQSLPLDYNKCVVTDILMCTNSDDLDLSGRFFLRLPKLWKYIFPVTPSSCGWTVGVLILGLELELNTVHISKLHYVTLEYWTVRVYQWSEDNSFNGPLNSCVSFYRRIVSYIKFVINFLRSATSDYFHIFTIYEMFSINWFIISLNPSQLLLAPRMMTDRLLDRQSVNSCFHA